MIKQFKPGCVTAIKISGKAYATFIDEQGVQRFDVRKVAPVMVCGKLIDAKTVSAVDFTLLQQQYDTQLISLEDLIWVYVLAKSTVDSFANLPVFAHLLISNPVWDNEDERNDDSL